ncbi:MAG: DUF3089 domain-containing protein [Caulobacteraceae bacterium]
MTARGFPANPFTRRRVAGGLGVLVCLGLLVAAFNYRGVILRASLDPKEPFQTYQPPPAPDYSRPESWALRPATPAKPGEIDVFFIHPTTYNGGEEWVGPIDHKRSSRLLDQVMLPNYAGPFQRVGRVFAPRYRQASLYAMLSLREDARDARVFAYGDVRRAFEAFLTQTSGRPFIVAGAEQGGQLGARLLAEIAARPEVRSRLVAAYLMDTLAPAEAFTGPDVIPLCAKRGETGCAVTYTRVWEGDESQADKVRQRGLVWDGQNGMAFLNGRTPACVNPVSGGLPASTKAENRGAANASRLEWGLRPAFLPHQVAARCEGGLLRVTRPTSPALKPPRGWSERMKASPFNLFYADLEADALARTAAYRVKPGG